MVLLSICLGFLVIVFAYIVWNLLSKLEAYENYFVSCHQSLVSVLERIRAVDNRKSFESDDEVGFTYEKIQSTILELEKFLIFEE